LFSNPVLILGILGIALATGLTAGSYPALSLSAIRPIMAFRRVSARGARGVLFRKTLVVSQFVLTICLVLGTIVVHQQMTFVRERNLGFDKEHVLCLDLKGDLAEKCQVLKARILGNSSVLGVAAASDLPAGNRMSMSLNDWEGRDTDALLTRWLSTFAFRISLNILLFVAAAAAALFIAFLTICIQALKAAVANPGHSLRHE
jgi:ABC-type antimicrobial peptide transport system permease subunit